jgi:hypothetical protein
MSEAPFLEHDDADSAIEARLRALPRATMSLARRREIVARIERVEAARDSKFAWLRAPVPLWQAVAAGVLLAVAAAAVATSLRNGDDPSTPLIARPGDASLRQPGGTDRPLSPTLIIDYRWDDSRPGAAARPRRGDWVVMPAGIHYNQGDALQ